MKKASSGLLLLFGIYFLTCIGVSPFYDYPIGDAWAYAKVAKHFYETGRFEILFWYVQSLVFQVVWALFFLIPFGFSFSLLNFSNTVMGGFALLFFYFFLRRLGFKERDSFWGTLLFLASPPFIFTTRTFYTEPSFMALYLAGMWAYTKGFRRRSAAWFGVGGLFLSGALLVRQVGVFLPVCLLWMLRPSKKWSLRHRLGAWLPLAALFLFTVWQHWTLKKIPPVNFLIALYSVRLDKVFSDMLRLPFFALLYFGYVLSPLLISSEWGRAAKEEASRSRRNLFCLSGAALGVTSLYFGRSGLWVSTFFSRGFTLKGAPVLIHVFVTLLGLVGASVLTAAYYPLLLQRVAKKYGWGLGAGVGVILVLFLPPVQQVMLSFGGILLPLLYHFFAPRIHLFHPLPIWQERLPALYHKILFALLGICLVAFFLLYFFPLFLKKKKTEPLLEKMEPAEKLLHGASLLYFLFLLGAPFVTTDRYLFPILPSAILLALRIGRPLPLHRGVAAFLVFSVLGLSLLHTDRLIQRVGALWEGGHRLMRQGIPVEKIDAGFVFNGWHLYEKRQREGFEGTDRGWSPSGWWVVDPEYTVSVTPPEGEEVIGTIPFRDLLTPGKDTVFISRRKR